MKDERSGKKIKLYIEIYNDIVSRIQKGEIKVGDKLPTTKELAKYYNVSIVTIEHAMRILKEMNIVYSVKKSGTFVNGKDDKTFQKVIAFVIPNDSGDSNEIYAKAEITALIHNCFLERMCSENSYERERKNIELILNGNYSGAIIYACCPNQNIDLYSQLKIKGIPCVFLDCGVDGLEVSLVTSDSEKGLQLLIDYLVSCGHTKIAFNKIRSGAYQTEKKRFYSYCKNLIEHGIVVQEKYIHKEKSRQSFLEWFENIDDKPTAIVCINDITAVNVIRVLNSAGYSVPQDVSVVGFDFSHLGTKINLTTISQNFGEIGRLAIEELCFLMRGGTSRVVYADVSLHLGDTVNRIN